MSVVCNSFLLTITMKRFTVYLFYVFIEGALSQYHVQENTDEAQNTKYAPEYNNYKPQNYEFEYGISDPHTGDHKSQWEKKEDGVIYGMYSLLDPDGSMRIVEYTADSINGFRAVVKKIPLHDGHQDITQSPQRHGFNTKLPEYNYAPYTQSARQEDHSKQQNEKPAVHNEEESAEYKKDVDEGPINTETEDVETHKNDEVEEDSGYINYDDENEKYKTDEEEEEDKYPHSLPYHSAEDDEEND